MEVIWLSWIGLDMLYALHGLQRCFGVGGAGCTLSPFAMDWGALKLRSLGSLLAAAVIEISETGRD